MGTPRGIELDEKIWFTLQNLWEVTILKLTDELSGLGKGPNQEQEGENYLFKHVI